VRIATKVVCLLVMLTIYGCGDEDVSSSGSQVSGVYKDKYGHVYQNCDNLWIDKDGDGFNGYNDINDADPSRH